MPVKDIARDVTTVAGTTGVDELGRTMLEEATGEVVVTADDEPAGVVTERDVVRVVARGGDTSELTAADIPCRDPVTIHGGATATALTERMVDRESERVVVVDDCEVAGVVTLDDVVTAAGAMLSDVATLLDRRFDG